MGLTAQSEIAQGPPQHLGQIRVLRSVAAFELAKGLVVLFAAVGIALLIQKEDPWDLADDLLQLLHISPDHHFAHVFLNWADTLTAAKLWAVAGAAIAYSVLRFAEAYGLWQAKAWAAWIALVSGALYLPFEIYGLARRVSLFHIVLLTVNLAIVLYMAYLLRTEGTLHGRHLRSKGHPS
jgi:uncharacterized membrane protein (DUF2068 family)